MPSNPTFVNIERRKHESDLCIGWPSYCAFWYCGSHIAWAAHKANIKFESQNHLAKVQPAICIDKPRRSQRLCLEQSTSLFVYWPMDLNYCFCISNVSVLSTSKSTKP